MFYNYLDDGYKVHRSAVTGVPRHVYMSFALRGNHANMLQFTVLRNGHEEILRKLPIHKEFSRVRSLYPTQRVRFQMEIAAGDQH